MVKTTQRFQRIARTLAELPRDFCVQNDLLSMYVGAASQHLLRMSFVPEQEAKNFDTQVAAFRSQLIQRDATSPLFFFAYQAWGLRIGSAVQRHAAPWRARQSVIPTLMATTHPYKHCTTTPSPTCSTSNHTLTTDEQASLPPQTTWLSPSPKKPHKRSGSPQSNDNSTSSFLKASRHPPSTVLCSSPNLLDTPEPLSCYPAVKRTRLRTAVSVLLSPGG